MTDKTKGKKENYERRPIRSELVENKLVAVME